MNFQIFTHIINQVWLFTFQKVVDQGTMVYHDDWSVYQNLDQYGYTHGTVVHKYEFKSAEGVCTNTIEGKCSRLQHM